MVDVAVASNPLKPTIFKSVVLVAILLEIGKAALGVTAVQLQLLIRFLDGFSEDLDRFIGCQCHDVGGIWRLGFSELALRSEIGLQKHHSAGMTEMAHQSTAGFLMSKLR